MSNVLRTVVTADDQAPVQEWVSVQKLIDDLGLAQARQRLSKLQAGHLLHKNVLDRATGRSPGQLEILSCPKERRDALADEIKETLMAAGPEQISKLSADQKVQLAQSATEPAVLAALAQERRSLRARRTVARNTSTPEFVLAILAEEPDSEIRTGVAANPATDERTLQRLTDMALSRDGDYTALISSLAGNATLPTGACVQLLDVINRESGDPNYGLRRAGGRLLDHPNLPDSTRESKMDDWSSSLRTWQRGAVADSVKAGRARLEKLAADSSVGWSAKQTLSRLA